jgi:RNA-dependent RNA polymerase
MSWDKAADSLAVGERPLPSMLGGGDLDGDTYNVWSSSYECACMASWSTIPLASRSLLIPENKAPEEYPAATKRKVQHKCTMEDVKSFVTDYIISNVGDVDRMRSG